MARARTPSNGRSDRLEEALTAMLQGQALQQQQLSALALRQAETDARFAENERHLAETERRIDATLAEHGRILNDIGRLLEEHGKMIVALTDAVRERIGFRPT